jgi:transposase
MRLKGMSMDAAILTALPAAPTAPPAPTLIPPSPQSAPPTIPLNAPLPDDLDTLKRMIQELLELLKVEKHRSEGLQHRLDQLLRRLYGPKGEKFRPDQPGLFDLLKELAAAEPAPPQPTPPPPPTEPAAARPKKKGHGRRSLPEDLRRERIEYDVPEAEKVCPCCQTRRIKIGEETSEQLDYQPAKLFVWEHVRLKYACPNCAKAAAKPIPTMPASVETPSPTIAEPASQTVPTSVDAPSSATAEPASQCVPASVETPSSATAEPASQSVPASVEAPSPSTAELPSSPVAAASTPVAIGSTVVVVAPKPAQPIDKGLPGPGLLAFVITSKYYDHLPLYRQELIIGRFGVDIPRSTLCGWMAASAELLRPLYDAMLADVLLSRVVQTDETRLPVLEKGNTKTKSGRLWAFVGDRDHPHTIYHYTATKARDGPAGILENYKGFLQADAANVFDGIYQPGDIVEVGCWAHGRRYFHDARTSDAARAAEALARIGFFYDVEREAEKIIDEQQLDAAQADAWRLKMRRERTLPKLCEFADWLDAQAMLVLPKSPIAQAINYARNHWQALLRFTEHGFLNIDNNASERAMRPAALGRKNYLFAGSDEGGRTTAVLYTFTQTCRRHGIDPFAYLQDVLTRLPKSDFQELADLFPHRCAEAQRAKADPSI